MQKVAEELGYRPHLAARSLRQTKPRHIGVAFAPVSAPEADLVEAIYPVAAGHGYQLVLSARTGTRSTRQAVDELLGYRCAAVIVIGQDPERMGTAAVRAAVRRIDQPALSPSVSVVEPWLVVRGSTGRPPLADSAPRSRARLFISSHDVCLTAAVAGSR